LIGCFLPGSAAFLGLTFGWPLADLRAFGCLPFLTLAGAEIRWLADTESPPWIQGDQ
jgi:hypothetical protein